MCGFIHSGLTGAVSLEGDWVYQEEGSEFLPWGLSCCKIFLFGRVKGTMEKSSLGSMREVCARRR